MKNVRLALLLLLPQRDWLKSWGEIYVVETSNWHVGKIVLRQ